MIRRLAWGLLAILATCGPRLAIAQVQDRPLSVGDTVEVTRRSIPNRVTYRFFVGPNVVPVTVYDTTHVPITVYDTTHVTVVLPDSVCDCADPAPPDTTTPPPPPTGEASAVERILGRAVGPAPHAKYDSIFQVWGDEHWARNGGRWEYTYYDRGMLWYRAALRGLGDEYFARGDADLESYIHDYVFGQPKHTATELRWGIPPRWVFTEGLALRYLRTGDQDALDALVGMANQLYAVWMPQLLTTTYIDGRIQGRVVMAQLMAYEVTGDSLYLDRTVEGINKLLGWPTGGFWPMRSYCYGQANFQVSHALLDVLIRYYDLVDPDPRIPPVVEASLDYMWDQWTPGQGFDYVSGVGTCPSGVSHPGTGPARDLNLLIVPAFKWQADRSGDPADAARVQEIFDTGLSTTYWNGHKQFNQSFMRSDRVKGEAAP